MTVSIRDLNNSQVYASKVFNEEISTTLTVLDDIEIPNNVSDGEYILMEEVPTSP